MPNRNHSLLGDGLKHYTDAMRALLKERLIARYPNGWWQQGVTPALTAQQRANIERGREKDPDKDKADFLDAAHIQRVVVYNFNDAFKGVFHDFQKTSAWLQTASNARTDWAHPRSGDLREDDVDAALLAMQRLLETAKLPAAAALAAVRKELSGAAQEAPAPPAQPAGAAPARAGELPYWWQACQPHDAFKNPSTIDPSLFAATLGGVHAGAARDEYLKPELFFAHTYFTENLKQTIADVASRLNKGPGPSVTELQTPFGGGKTHALLALYHLIRNPAASLAVPGVREALAGVVIPSNARVLVFDGQEHGTEPLVKETGATVFTLWGELAWQADPLLYTKLIQQTDERGEAPGNALYRQALQTASPCLILIDELVSYLVKLKFSSSRRTQALYRQTTQFLQELLQEAGNVPGVAVLLSLPKSPAEFGGLDSRELEMQLGVLPELQARADRVVSKRTPVNDDEIYTLTTKRLFKTIDPAAAERVAKMFRAAYENGRALYDSTLFSEDYLTQQVAAYPLHPELIDVLYKKWSTASDFPRTRTMLQLLALIVADAWVLRREAYVIQSGHVNLERESIKTKVVSASGGGGYDIVVATDIIGGAAHADQLDERKGGDYQRFQIARGVATSLLMHSFGGKTRVGALPAELYLSMVAPNLGPEYVREVLEELEQTLWYVHRDGDLRRFQTKPNIYRVIAQRAEHQPQPVVAEKLRQVLSSAVGSAAHFRALEWAGADGALPDRPDPAIAVLEPRYALSGDKPDDVSDRKPIEALWERSGGGLREFRNAVLLVAPDKELWANAEQAVRETLAYDQVLEDVQHKTRGFDQLDISTNERKELQSRANDKRESLRTSLVTAYRWLFYPDAQGLSLLALPTATRGEQIAKRVVERLSDQNYAQLKILPSMAAFYFNAKVAPHVWKDESEPLELSDLRRRFRQWTYLPLLPAPDETLRACIREGIDKGFWALALGDNSSMTYTALIDEADALTPGINLFDGYASLVRGEYLELVRAELRKAAGEPPQPPPELVGADLIPEPAPSLQPPVGPMPAPSIPQPARYRRVRLRVPNLRVTKTNNLQPYLFKALQEQDPLAELLVTIEVTSEAGVSRETLDDRIVEGLRQLNIDVSWESDDERFVTP